MNNTNSQLTNDGGRHLNRLAASHKRFATQPSRFTPLYGEEFLTDKVPFDTGSLPYNHIFAPNFNQSYHASEKKKSDLPQFETIPIVCTKRPRAKPKSDFIDNFQSPINSPILQIKRVPKLLSFNFNNKQNDDSSKEQYVKKISNIVPIRSQSTQPTINDPTMSESYIDYPKQLSPRKWMPVHYRPESHEHETNKHEVNQYSINPSFYQNKQPRLISNENLNNLNKISPYQFYEGHLMSNEKTNIHPKNPLMINRYNGHPKDNYLTNERMFNDKKIRPSTSVPYSYDKGSNPQINRSCLNLNMNNSGNCDYSKFRTLSASTNNSNEMGNVQHKRSSSTLTINIDRKPIELDIQLNNPKNSQPVTQKFFDLGNSQQFNEYHIKSKTSTPLFQDNRMINSFSFKSNNLSKDSPLSNTESTINLFNSNDHGRRAPTIVKKYSSISRNPSRPSSRASSQKPFFIDIENQNSPINIIDTPLSSITPSYEIGNNILKKTSQLPLNTNFGEKWSAHQEKTPQNFCSRKTTELSPLRTTERNAHIVAASANRAMRRPRTQRYHTIK
ncbi:hypothetical protein SNEBB_007738 [Seison nebaliae]|nr:hypothetical protein SNEBB_007738 [Seison nebaliae]